VPPAGERGFSELAVRAAPAGRGWTAGTVALPPDELRGDDTRHFAVWLGPPPRLTADASAGPFALAAVDALVESGRAARGGDVAIVGADALQRLPALIAAPVDPVRVGAANRALERAGVPWRFGQLRAGEQPVTGLADSAAGRVLARRRYALVPQPGAVADTVARVGAEPWIVAGDNYVLVSSPLVPEATTLPVRAAFVPLVASLVGERLGGPACRRSRRGPAPRSRCRRTWTHSSRARAAFPSRPAARRPAPRAPGVYWFERSGARVGALVVNVESEESVLQRVTPQELSRRIGARRVATATSGAALAALAFRSGDAGRPLGGALLVAALVALAAETALGRRRGRAA
jgi:hypothetical protein